MIERKYQKSILDAYNSASQTVTANGNVVFNGTTVDSGSSITQTASDTFTIYNPGLYGVRFNATATNATSSPVLATLELISGTNVIAGTITSATVPETGSANITITKDIEVKANTTNVFATININSPTGVTLSEANITIERKA